MAVKASNFITLSSVIDVKATYRYYLLQSSTLAKPNKPTTQPPGTSWSNVEPTYTDGSTNTLYFVDCTVFCDDTFSYSEVSVSSSYEAAKAAYNKAVNAQQSADNAAKVATNYMKLEDTGLIVGNLTNDVLGKNVLIDTDSVDIRDGTTVLASYAANQIDLGVNNDDTVINICNSRGQIYFDSDESYGAEGGFLYIESEEAVYVSGGSSTAIRSRLEIGDVDNPGYYGESNVVAYKPINIYYGISLSSYLQGTDDATRDQYYGSSMLLNPSYIELRNSDLGNDLSTCINMNEEYSGRIDMTATNGVRIFDNEFRANNEFWAAHNVIIPNNRAFYALNASGASRRLMSIDTDNITHVAYGGYSAQEGSTYIYGHSIRMCARPNTAAWWHPYWGAGQTTSGTYHGAGYITSSKTKVHMTISLGKPIIATPTITVTSVSGLMIRQGGNYLYGSSSSSWAKPSSINAYKEYTTHNSSVIHIVFEMPNTTNADNNVPCGITASIQIAFT